MPLNHIYELKKQGELAREQRNYAGALSSFRQALIEALKDKQFKEAIQIIGHETLVYKLLFDGSENQPFLEMLYSTVATGMHLAKIYSVSGHPLSVMHLRLGDYYFLKEQYSEALEAYQNAITELIKSPHDPAYHPTYAEYMGHLAAALSKTGNHGKALEILTEALSVLTKNPHPQQLNHLSIRSGLLLRCAGVYAERKDYRKAQTILREAKPLATTLSRDYLAPNRLMEIKDFAAKHKLSI